ncbi:MAG TPA: hypothetical protein VGF26_25865, partial [Ramlibacter sp.]
MHRVAVLATAHHVLLQRAASRDPGHEFVRLRRIAAGEHGQRLADRLVGAVAEHALGTAIARDVSEQVAARETLRATDERLRLLVENARDYAIFAFDLERRVTMW